MAQFLVFTFYANAPLGGAHDFLDRFETVEEALENILPEPRRYYQILRSDTMKVVKEGLALYKDFDNRAFQAQ